MGIQEITNIQKVYETVIQTFRDWIIRDALTMLHEDLRNPDLPEISGVPQDDIFMMRANQVVLAFFSNDLTAASERMLRGLIQETQAYDKETGNRHHLGALYANTALACIAQGNYDQGIVELLAAARDDEDTRGVPRSESFAVTDLLENVFDLTRKSALALAHSIDAGLTLASVKNLKGVLGDIPEYAFLAYARQASTHIETNRDFPNEFSQMQVFSALRNLSCLFEVELKALAGAKEKTFHPTMQVLFEDNTTWWTSFENTRKKIGATQNSPRSVDDQLKDAIALSPSDPDMVFWKSLLVTYIVRNYTVHQMETQCALVQIYSEEALGHILHAIIAAPALQVSPLGTLRANTACSRRRFAALYRGAIWLCEAF